MSNVSWYLLDDFFCVFVELETLDKSKPNEINCIIDTNIFRMYIRAIVREKISNEQRKNRILSFRFLRKSSSNIWQPDLKIQLILYCSGTNNEQEELLYLRKKVKSVEHNFFIRRWDEKIQFKTSSGIHLLNQFLTKYIQTLSS